MAVKFKTKTSANDLILTSLGVGPDFLENLHKANVEITSSFTTLKLKAPNGAEMTIPLGTTVNNIVKGNLSLQIKQAVKGTVESSIKKFLLGMAYGGTNIPPVGKSPNSIPTTTPIQLKDATIMYQPVKGTSTGSTYFVIAMNDQIRVATRILSHRVSIRVEGKITPDISKALSKVEIQTHPGSVYASGHFELTNGVDAGRVIGAVLLGSGIQFSTPMPSMKLLETTVNS